MQEKSKSHRKNPTVWQRKAFYFDIIEQGKCLLGKHKLCSQPCTLIQTTDSESDRQTDGWISQREEPRCYAVIMSSFRCGQQGSVSESPYMVPLFLFLCLCLSTQSLHPLFFRQPITPLHTHTHTFWHTYTQKRMG